MDEFPEPHNMVERRLKAEMKERLKEMQARLLAARIKADPSYAPPPVEDGDDEIEWGREFIQPYSWKRTAATLISRKLSRDEEGGRQGYEELWGRFVELGEYMDVASMMEFMAALDIDAGWIEMPGKVCAGFTDLYLSDAQDNEALRQIHDAQRQLFDLFKTDMMNLCQRFAVDDLDVIRISKGAFHKCFNALPDFKHTGEDSLPEWIKERFVAGCGDFEVLTQLRFDTTAAEIWEVVNEQPEAFRLAINFYVHEAATESLVAHVFDIRMATARQVLEQVRYYLMTFFRDLIEPASPCDPDEALRRILKRKLDKLDQEHPKSGLEAAQDRRSYLSRLAAHNGPQSEKDRFWQDVAVKLSVWTDLIKLGEQPVPRQGHLQGSSMNKKTEHEENLCELRKKYDRRSRAAQGLNVMPPFDEDLMWCEIAWKMAQENPLMSESTIRQILGELEKDPAWKAGGKDELR